MHMQQNKYILSVGLEDATLNILQKGIDELNGNFKLEQIDSGTEALEKISSGVYPVILAGGFLRDMTGLHLAREIKTQAPNTEVLLIMPSDVNCFNDFEFDSDVDHLLKEPISIAHIQKIVKESFRRGARLMQPPQPEEPLVSQEPEYAAAEPIHNVVEEPKMVIDLESTLSIDSVAHFEEHVQTPDHDDQIHEKLLTLRHSTSSRCVMLLSSSGHVIDCVGDTNRLNVTNVSALIAANYMATSELAKFVGNDSLFKSTYHAGSNYDIFSYGLNEDFLIVSIFDSNSKIGLVRFGIKEVAEPLIDLLNAQQRTFDFSDKNIQSSIDQELDKLFAG